MADAKLEALGRVPLFARCRESELAFLASRMEEVTVGDGQVLTTQGRPNDTFFVILEGSVEVAVDGRPRRRMGPGDFFGEISMVDRGPATATATANGPVRVMVMSHDQFGDAVKRNDEVFNQVMIAMAMRLRQDALDHEERGFPG